MTGNRNWPTWPYSTFSGHALEEYFRRKFAESGQWTRIGAWWDRKGENELDMLCENEIDETYAVCEIKRDSSRIDTEILKDKFTAFQRASGKWKSVRPAFTGLSLDDM